MKNQCSRYINLHSTFLGCGNNIRNTRKMYQSIRLMHHCLDTENLSEFYDQICRKIEDKKTLKYYKYEYGQKRR